MFIDEHDAHTGLSFVVEYRGAHRRWAAQTREERRVNIEEPFLRDVEKTLRKDLAVVDDYRDVPFSVLKSVQSYASGTVCASAHVATSVFLLHKIPPFLFSGSVTISPGRNPAASSASSTMTAMYDVPKNAKRTFFMFTRIWYVADSETQSEVSQMRKTIIAATEYRGHIDIEYDPDHLRAVNGVSEHPPGEAIVLEFVHSGDWAVRVPRLAKESTFETADIALRDTVDGGDRNHIQTSIMFETSEGRKTIARVTFNAPFWCPEEEVEPAKDEEPRPRSVH